MVCRDGQNFINRCTKPDRAEFLKISQAIGVGFVIMGTIGFIVKLGMRRPSCHISDLGRYVFSVQETDT